MADLNLFDFIPVPAVRSSPTSVAAAEALKPAVSSWREKVLGLIREAGEHGLTDEELIAMTGGRQGSRARRIGLTHARYVRDSGRTRITAAGRQAAVWVADLNPSEPR